MIALFRPVIATVSVGVLLLQQIPQIVLAQTEDSLDRIYEESIQQYILQDTFYLQVRDTVDGDELFGKLQKDGVVSEFSQPFASLDIPYYRVEFSVRPDVARRTIAFMMKNGSLQAVEAVPLFKIQQDAPMFSIPTTTVRSEEDLAKSRTENAFSTQQITPKTQPGQWYITQVGLVKDKITCLMKDPGSVKVAIIDNAFMVDHPNIKNSIEKAVDVSANDTDVAPPSLDEEWMHGTHSAGLVAGRKHNAKGIIGSSLGSARIYALKATRDDTLPTDITHGIEAVAKAVELGVDVISLSRGSYMDFPVFKQVIKKAQAKGVDIIAAAGNYGEEKEFYPAAYEGVVAVGAYDLDQNISSFSNYGDRVDVYAPGEELTVPVRTSTYSVTEGTSSATPLYAGMYALMLRHLGRDASPSDVVDATTQTDADDLPMMSLDALCETFPTQENPSEPAPIVETDPVIEHPVAPEPAVESQKDLSPLLWIAIGVLGTLCVVLILWVINLKKKNSEVSSVKENVSPPAPTEPVK